MIKLLLIALTLIRTIKYVSPVCKNTLEPGDTNTDEHCQGKLSRTGFFPRQNGNKHESGVIFC